MLTETATTAGTPDLAPPPGMLVDEADRDLAAGRIDARVAAERYRDAAMALEGRDSRYRLELLDRAVALDPAAFWGWLLRARVALEVADLERAGQSVDRLDALAATAGRRQRLMADTTAGALAMVRGLVAEAAARFTRACELGRELVASRPAQPVYRHDLVLALGEAAAAFALLDREEEALAATTEAADLTAALVAAYPDDERWPGELARTVAARGDIELGMGRVETARASYRQALGLLRRIVEANPRDPARRHELTACLERFGSALSGAGATAAALEVFREGLDLTEALVAADPENRVWAWDRTLLRTKLGSQLDAIGDVQEALRQLDQALAEAEALATAHPDHARHGMLVVNVLVARGEVLANGDGSDAFASFMRAARTLKALDDRGLAPPDHDERQRWLMGRMMQLAIPADVPQ
ncbi:MAG: hypothetical protein U1E14_03230 [Geminicoccaceae bacterium]